MKRIKPIPFSHLLTPILLIGTLLFAGLMTFFSIKTDKREEESVKKYTHARMKSLILELETRAISLEAAMITTSHMKTVTVNDSVTIYRRVESLCRDMDYVSMAGVDLWDDFDDPASTSLYVTRRPDGGFDHNVMVEYDTSVPEAEMSCIRRAYESGEPEWSTPYIDEVYNTDCVLTCYYRASGQEAMVYADVQLELLLHTIDSLQFYTDGQMYISIPDGPTFTMEEGNRMVRVKKPTYDKKEFYEISAHYRRLNLDIIYLVPRDKIYSAFMDDLSVLLVIFILGLALLAFFVDKAFKHAQTRLKQTIEESNAEQMARKHLEDEIAIAARIQNKMLTYPGKPAHFHPEGCNAVDLTSRIIPAREVGGDLYEYRLSGDSLFFCIGDVSGKGIPSAMVMSRSSTLFHAYVSHAHAQDPSDFLQFMNQQLCRHNEDVMFVTMFAGLLDLRTGKLAYASAGHNPPVLMRDGAAAFLDMTQGQPLGMFDDSEYPLCVFAMKENDLLLLYTDGITEAEGPGHVLFGDGKLIETCSGTVPGCPETICHDVLNAIHTHTADCDQSDDITLLAVAYGSKMAQLKGIEDVPAIHVLTDETGASEEMTVAIEEAAVNALTHGGANFVCVKPDGQGFTLYYDGDDFDPTKYVAPPASDEMQIGGRGIFLMRQFTKDLIYTRTPAGLNVLTLEI